MKARKQGIRTIRAVAWNRFHTRFLAVDPTLLGKTHSFKYLQHSVKLTVPSADTAKLLAEQHAPPRDGARVELLAWRKQGRKNVPTIVAIADVDLLIEIPQSIRVHAQMLVRPPNAYDLLSEADVSSLNRLGTQFRGEAEAAIDYWFRVLRWKSRLGSIGRPLVRDSRTGWATYLLDKRSRQRLWAAPLTATALLATPVTPPQWREAQRALTKGEQPPIYFDLYFDGVEHKKISDFQRSVVDFAVSCEVLMRKSLMDSLPTSFPPGLTTYIDHAHIRPVMTKFFPELLSQHGRAALDAISSKLNRLFDARNDILHSGHAQGLTEPLVSEFQAATLRLISLPDDTRNWLH